MEAYIAKKLPIEYKIDKEMLSTKEWINYKKPRNYQIPGFFIPIQAQSL